jgi:prepilin-type N-terminal cleavage/methylation domain-containing protein
MLQDKGFTLIELLIVFAILVVVAALSVPFIQSFQVSSDLYTHADTITKTLRLAQQKAITGQEGSSWGVYFGNGAKKFILFRGDDYALRDQGYDQEEVYPDVFTVSTDFGDEIYFSLYSGQPSTNGTITIASANNESKDIVIKTFGLIQIND